MHAWTDGLGSNLPDYPYFEQNSCCYYVHIDDEEIDDETEIVMRNKAIQVDTNPAGMVGLIPRYRSRVLVNIIIERRLIPFRLSCRR